MTECDGIDDAVLLDSFRILHPVSATGFDRLESVYLRVLDDARARHQWSRHVGAARASIISSTEAHAAIAEAVATDRLVAYLPTDAPGEFAEYGAPQRPATWIPGGPRADLAALRGAALMGGLVARGCGRHSSTLARLGDDLALAHGAQIELLVVRGTLPPGSSLVAGATSLVIVALDGPVEISCPDGVARTVTEGYGCRVGVDASLSAAAGTHSLVAVLAEPTNAFVWSFAAHKAGNHPLARTDIPYDLTEPVAIYGLEDPVLLGPVIREVIGGILTDETAGEAMAAWRASLRPLDRPRPDLAGLPPDVEDWPQLVLTGHFPGGVTQLGEPDGERAWLAAGGYAFRTHAHLVPLFEALLTGLPVALADLAGACTNGDELCVHRAIDNLLWVGLVDVAPVGGSWP